MAGVASETPGLPIAASSPAPHIGAVSQLQWPDKDREMWFSSGENQSVRSGLSTSVTLGRPLASGAKAQIIFGKLRHG
jgi:hypothetical protein